MSTPSKLSDRLQALIRDSEIPLSDAWGKLIDDLKITERSAPTHEATDLQVTEAITHMESEGDMLLVPRMILGAALGAIKHPHHESGVTIGALRHYAFQKKLMPQPVAKTADHEMLNRLAIILSGSDAPGEIKALTVTAQSFVDRCKVLAKERELAAGSVPSEVMRCLEFFACVIKSGEPWTDTCEREYKAATHAAQHAVI